MSSVLSYQSPRCGDDAVVYYESHAEILRKVNGHMPEPEWDMFPESEFDDEHHCHFVF